jgi:hypothetical protein
MVNWVRAFGVGHVFGQCPPLIGNLRQHLTQSRIFRRLRMVVGVGGQL